ncbi:MAG TPA: hypothetical protein VFC31_01150 [Candidatus Limnocylindria bacterium]|nr:hypothetical protein [Candidatus Limnocylindria bacterium]
MRNAAFWFWFAIATVALGRLWWAVDHGGLFARFGAADAAALVALVVAGFVLARVQSETARAGRK